MQDKQNKKKLSLKVHDRASIIFEGEVRSVTSVNDKGKFDVLERHSNFITLVTDRLEIILPNGETKEIFMNNGVMKVEEGKVDVFLGVAF